MEPNKEQWFNFNRRTLLVNNRSCSLEESSVVPRFSLFKQKGWLGEGTFGLVYEADTDVYKNRTCVALKVIREKLNQQNAAEELKMLISLSHDNVIKCLGAYYHNYPTIIMEKAYCDIYYYCPTITEVKRIFIDLINGLGYIHQKGFLHCDIKTANLLVADGKAKIADLGSVTKLDEEQGYIILEKHKCTYAYSPPDTLKLKKMDKWSDLYSLAISIWECIARKRFIVPYGNWFKIIKLYSERELMYYQFVHKYGRFVEKGINNCPYLKKELLSKFKYTHLQLMDHPDCFETRALDKRLNDFVSDVDLKTLLANITSFDATPSLLNAESVRSTFEFQRLARNDIVKNLVLRYKVPVGRPNKNVTLNPMDPEEQAPSFNLDNSEMALNFFYVNKEEVYLKVDVNLNTKTPQKQPLLMKSPVPVKVETKSNHGIVPPNVPVKQRKPRIDKDNRRIQFGFDENGRKKYICRVDSCKKHFFHKQSLCRHEKLEHGQLLEDKPQCIHCDQICQTKLNLIKHMTICKMKPIEPSEATNPSAATGFLVPENPESENKICNNNVDDRSNTMYVDDFLDIDFGETYDNDMNSSSNSVFMSV